MKKISKKDVLALIDSYKDYEILSVCKHRNGIRRIQSLTNKRHCIWKNSTPIHVDYETFVRWNVNRFDEYIVDKDDKHKKILLEACANDTSIAIGCKVK